MSEPTAMISPISGQYQPSSTVEPTSMTIDGNRATQDRVVEQVERPHAARHLAHGRAGEAVGMPVGREPLHAVERVGRDVGHHLQRQVDDRDEGDVPQHDRTAATARRSVENAAIAASQITASLAAPLATASTSRPE